MMTHPLWLVQNLITHPFARAQNLLTHPLFAPNHLPPSPLYLLTSPLLTKHEVKMAGFWPSFQFLARRARSRDPLTRQTQNKERTFLYGVWFGFGENISCGTQRVISKGQGHSAFSPARVANNGVGFGSSLPCGHQFYTTKQSLKVLSSSGIRGTKFISVFNSPAQ